MKKIALTILGVAISVTANSSTLNTEHSTQITVENTTGNTVYLQPEELDGYNKVEGATSTVKIDVAMPCYWRFAAGDQFYSLYVTPGADIHISCTAEGVSITGDNKAENDFIRENTFICRVPAEIKQYSAEWTKYNDEAVARLYEKLDNSGLAPEFIATHKLYVRFVYDNQRLGGVRNAIAFGAGAGRKVEVADGFYSFLKGIDFSDRHILSIPKWFNVIDDAMEEMERQEIIEVSNAHYVARRAAYITNDDVRSMYIVELLKKMLKKGYFDDFMSHFDEVKPLVTAPEAQSQLPEIVKQYEEVRKTNLGISRGMQMPDFTANDLSGKEYHLSDFKGKVTVLDFWFTGCVPCKAEMPFLEKLADELSGDDVCFISVSLDTGNALLAAWRKIIESKDENCKVLNLNLPGGFKSDFMKTMNIKFVPRIMLIGKDGKIIDTYAKKPSDPKLRQQIKELNTKQ